MILRQLHVRYFFHYVSAFFSPSQSNHEYLLRYGAEASRIHRYPYPVEFGRFNCGNISGREYDFVWVGKLSARKRPLDYLNALKILKQRGHANFRASLIGDGELMDSVLREGHNLIQSGNLVVHGFVNQNRMPLELGKCKIFVFTSEREPYGLVASEAAAAGAALVVADRIGCVGPDSVAQPGVNTLTYPVGDITVLADVIERLFADQILLESMQKASLIIATEHDASKAAYVITNTLVNS